VADARVAGRQSAKTIAYEHVKKLVLGAPRNLGGGGFFLSEGEVAGSLGISRTPVREAFLTLEAERLLQLVPGKGAHVAPVSDREAQEVMEARLLIEVFCAERVATVGLQLTEQLHTLIEEQRMVLTDPEAFIEADRRFHSMIVGAARHAVLAQMYESLRDRQLRAGITAVVSRPARAEQVLREHLVIIEALATGDPARVRAGVEEHLQLTMETFRDNWRSI
jgi:DNA-binding GntR family transcriptional regulator